MPTPGSSPVPSRQGHPLHCVPCKIMKLQGLVWSMYNCLKTLSEESVWNTPVAKERQKNDLEHTVIPLKRNQVLPENMPLC